MGYNAEGHAGEGPGGGAGSGAVGAGTYPDGGDGGAYSTPGHPRGTPRNTTCGADDRCYGDAELSELLGGSGGGGGGDGEGNREAAGGGGSGGAILLSSPVILLDGTLTAVGGEGGTDEEGNPNQPILDGESGGDGRIKLVASALQLGGLAVMTPLPGSMPALQPFVAGDFVVEGPSASELNCLCTGIGARIDESAPFYGSTCGVMLSGQAFPPFGGTCGQKRSRLQSRGDALGEVQAACCNPFSTTVNLNTDGSADFFFDSLTVEAGATLWGRGTRPLVITVAGACDILGTIRVDA
eukprot:SAG22_NODE_4778_length_1166_cov_1.057170_1_plen_296_part_10